MPTRAANDSSEEGSETFVVLSLRSGSCKGLGGIGGEEGDTNSLLPEIEDREIVDGRCPIATCVIAD